jgi:hypothetical protein
MYSSLLLEAPEYRDLIPMYPDYRALLSGKPYAGLGPDVIANGGFTGGLTGWSVFWTGQGIAWDTAAGTAMARNDGTTAGEYASANQTPGNVPNIPTTGPRLLRVTGRVRSTDRATTTEVQVYTNTAPEPPQPFAPGVAVTVAVVPSGPAWSTFAVDLAVPNAAHDSFSVVVRSGNMPVAALVEWDDITARWHT